MSTLEKRLSATITQKEFIHDLWNCPTVYFDLYPMDWVRDECLKALRESSYCVDNECASDWAEKWILFLLKQRSSDDKKRAIQILSWYLFANLDCRREDQKIVDLTVRAVEFAISLYHNHDFFSYQDKLAKEITGRLRKSDGALLYSKIKGIKEFLSYLVVEIWGIGIVRRIRFKDISCQINEEEWYLEGGWLNQERVLGVIQNVEDFSFIPLFEQTLQFLTEGTIFPKYGPPYQKNLNIVVLRETINNLRKKCVGLIRERHNEQLQTELARARSGL